MTVEKAYISGSKFMGVVFEAALLANSILFHASAANVDTAVAILLSVFSMSFSAVIALFDEGFLYRYSNYKPMRVLIKVAILCSGLSVAISFFALATVQNVCADQAIWSSLRLALFILATPNIFVYFGDSASAVNGVGSGDKAVFEDYISEIASEFEGR